MKPSDIRPTAMAILSMDDTIETAEARTGGVIHRIAAALIRAPRASLAALHGEPTTEEREAWLSLTPGARRLLLEAAKGETLRGGR